MLTLLPGCPSETTPRTRLAAFEKKTPLTRGFIFPEKGVYFRTFPYDLSSARTWPEVGLNRCTRSATNPFEDLNWDGSWGKRASRTIREEGNVPGRARNGGGNNNAAIDIGRD